MTRRNVARASDIPSPSASRNRLWRPSAVAGGLLMGALSLLGCREDALLKAARNNDLPAVKSIVEQGGTNIDLRDDTGHTALMAAASHGGRSVVAYLMDKGAKVDLKNKEGWTPLAYAVTVHDLEIVKLLLDKGADANAKFKHFQDGERTILMQAVATTEGEDAKDKGYQTIQLLVARGAQIDAQDEHGETALMYAVRSGKPGLVQLLLASKANPGLRNKKNQTALDIATSQDQKKVVDVLAKASAS
jgi:ankyrin repeat protein